MIHVPVVLLSVVSLVRAGPDWLESEQQNLLQLAQNHSTPKSGSAQDIIDKHFAGIPAGGGYVRSNLISQDETEDPGRSFKTAAWACSSIDFTSFRGTGVDKGVGVKLIMDNLDPTCRAFWAAMNAHLELQQLGFDPVFKRMAVVNWYANRPGHFPSWGSGDGVTVKYSGGKFESVTINDPNAVSGYAFCDIMYTILRQNFDQAGRGQCSPTAVLTAKASTNPAGAMKMGLELFWTGTINGTPKNEGCPFIYSDTPPGVIPFAENQPGTEGSDGQPLSIGSDGCSGNSADCQVAEGSPFTNAGLQGMFAIRMSARRDFLSSGRSCAEDDHHAYVSYPGMGPRFRKLADGFYPDQIASVMNAAFGRWFNIRTEYVEANRPSEKAALNKICSSKGGAVVLIPSTLLSAVLWDERGGGIGMTEENPWRQDGATYQCGDYINDEENFNNDPDHSVYIDKCTGDVVSMWSWTGRFYFTRKALLFWGGGGCHERWLAIYDFHLVPGPEETLA
ncbi:unnamed protein product [Symbiodinium sp. CCMP2592]|nr:unnamed protein product [Symbiodinium sp. CCMP2592]